MRGFPLLLHRKRSLRAIRLYVAAQTVCAVQLGARVERLRVGRLAGTRRCDIAGFEALPLFSKLIICLVGWIIKTKTGTAVDDRVELRRARALAMAASPTSHEAERLIRLAQEEAGRIVGERWAAVSQLASLLEQRKVISGDRIARIVYRPGKPRSAMSSASMSTWEEFRRELAEAREILGRVVEFCYAPFVRMFRKRGGRTAQDEAVPGATS